MTAYSKFLLMQELTILNRLLLSCQIHSYLNVHVWKFQSKCIHQRQYVRDTWAPWQIAKPYSPRPTYMSGCTQKKVTENGLSVLKKNIPWQTWINESKRELWWTKAKVHSVLMVLNPRVLLQLQAGQEQVPIIYQSNFRN